MFCRFLILLFYLFFQINSALYVNGLNYDNGFNKYTLNNIQQQHQHFDHDYSIISDITSLLSNDYVVLTIVVKQNNVNKSNYSFTDWFRQYLQIQSNKSDKNPIQSYNELISLLCPLHGDLSQVDCGFAKVPNSWLFAFDQTNYNNNNNKNNNNNNNHISSRSLNKLLEHITSTVSNESWINNSELPLFVKRAVINRDSLITPLISSQFAVDTDQSTIKINDECDSIALKREVGQSGFHRMLSIELSFDQLNSCAIFQSVSSSNACSVYWLEHLPESVFVDVYELEQRRLHFSRSNNDTTMLSSFQLMELEKPMELSKQYALSVFTKINISTQTPLHLQIPLHLRYHAADFSKSTFRTILLSPPNSLFVNCGNLNNSQEWKRIKVISDIVQMQIPIGDTSIHPLIQFITFAVSSLQAIAIAITVIRKK